MNIIEKIVYGLGKTIGLYHKGIESAFSTSGARPSLMDDTAWGGWGSAWGEGVAQGKKPVSKEQFVQYFKSWFYICSKFNGQGVASVPLRLYVAKESKGKSYSTIRTKAIDKPRLKWLQSNAGLEPWLSKAAEVEEVIEHPFMDILKNVNPYNNRFDLWELTTMFLDLTGECYWYLPSVKMGEASVPQQIWIIPSQFINPKFGKTLDKAIESYEYIRGNTTANLPVDDVVMFAYPNPHNTFTGFSIVRGIAEEVYIQSQMNEFEQAILENRARVGGVVEETETIGETERERIKQKLRQEHSGVKKAGKTLYLPKGLKHTKDSMTPEEISFIEGQKLNRTVIMAALDIPEGMFISESSNRAVADAAIYLHAKFGINPRCQRIQEKMNERIISRYDEKLFVAFDDPVPEDKEFAMRKNVEYVRENITKRNEVRAEEGKEPVAWGDSAWFPAMVMPVSDGGEAGQAERIAKRAKEIIRERLLR
jgi:HK97 family phage portal protein